MEACTHGKSGRLLVHFATLKGFIHAVTTDDLICSRISCPGYPEEAKKGSGSAVAMARIVQYDIIIRYSVIVECIVH